MIHECENFRRLIYILIVKKKENSNYIKKFQSKLQSLVAFAVTF